MAAICRICHEQPPKYKCPTCKIAYCSLACSKRHQALGHDFESTTEKPIAYEAPIAEEPAPPPRQFAHSRDDGFKTLAESAEFKHLLTRYPRLKSRLKKVYDATVEPLNSNDGGYPGRGGYRGRSRGQYDNRQQGPWTQRKGDEAAMRLIRRARELDESGDGEGMGEFVALIHAKSGGLKTDLAGRVSAN